MEEWQGRRSGGKRGGGGRCGDVKMRNWGGGGKEAWRRKRRNCSRM